MQLCARAPFWPGNRAQIHAEINLPASWYFVQYEMRGGTIDPPMQGDTTGKIMQSEVSLTLGVRGKVNRVVFHFCVWQSIRRNNTKFVFFAKLV